MISSTSGVAPVSITTRRTPRCCCARTITNELLISSVNKRTSTAALSACSTLACFVTLHREPEPGQPFPRSRLKPIAVHLPSRFCHISAPHQVD